MNYDKIIETAFDLIQKEDQALIDETLAETKPISSNYPKEHKTTREDNSNAEWYMEAVDSKLTQSKQHALDELRRRNYRTPPPEVSILLGVIFHGCPNVKDGHWLYIARHWPPRAIVRTIDSMNKQVRNGAMFKNPAALFTFAIQHRKRRRFPKKTMEAVDSQFTHKVIATPVIKTMEAVDTKLVVAVKHTPFKEEKRLRALKPSVCYFCRGTDFWMRRDGGWVCSQCHPCPFPFMDYQGKFTNMRILTA